MKFLYNLFGITLPCIYFLKQLDIKYKGGVTNTMKSRDGSSMLYKVTCGTYLLRVRINRNEVSSIKLYDDDKFIDSSSYGRIQKSDINKVWNGIVDKSNNIDKLISKL